MRYWATVCKTVRPKLSDRCLSVCPVLSLLRVTLVYCGQTVGRIKMKLGMQVGLGPGHAVLDGDPGSPPKGAQPPIFGSIDQDVTWYESRPRPRPHCARWGPSSPPQKGGTDPFRPMFVVAKRLVGSRCHLVRR